MDHCPGVAEVVGVIADEQDVWKVRRIIPFSVDFCNRACIIFTGEKCCDDCFKPALEAATFLYALRLD